MGKEETLLRLKEAEAEVRALKDAAERDRETILRDARREALELHEKLRDEAEARYRDRVAEAAKKVEAERAKVLAVGQAGANAMSARSKANVDQAVDAVLEKFKGALHA